MVFNNDSTLSIDKNRVSRKGLPTEAAIKVLSEKIGRYDPLFKNKFVPLEEGGVEQYGTYLSSNYKKVATLEFSRDRKSMSVLALNKQTNQNLLFIKGAPDYLLKSSKKVLNKQGEAIDFTAESQAMFLEKVKDYAKKGLRTLAICVKYDAGKLNGYDGPTHPGHALLQDANNFIEIEKEPILIGVVAVRDPPRKEVSASIKKCREAGISVIMITGDIKETAECIAKEIGIIEEGEENERSLTG